MTEPQNKAPTRPPTSAEKQSRSGWMFISGALLMLVGLAMWMHRLQQSTPADTAADGGPAPKKLVADGPRAAGAPLPVPFGQERCVPWHVSETEAPPGEGVRILILTSRIVDPYSYTASGFGQACGQGQAVLFAEDTSPAALKEAVLLHQPAAILAVGLPSVDLARAAAGEVPLLYAKIPDPAERGLDDGARVGVVPWVPVEALVRHLIRVLPGKKTRWAILAPEGHMGELAERAERAARTEGRQVTRFTVSDPVALAETLKKAAASSNAWLVLPDRQVIDRQVFNRIQIAAEQERIPLCVPDEEHVRAGAYAGVGSDSHRIGEQLCHLAGALVRGELPQGSRVFCPEYSFAVLHGATIEKLGYILDPQQMEQAKLYKWH